MRKLVIPVAAGILLLAGCAAPSSPESAQPSASNPPKTEKPAGWTYCEKLVAGMSDYADFIAATAEGDVDMNMYAVQERWVRELEGTVPEDGKSQLEDYIDPINQMRDVVAAGGGNLTFNTDRFKDGALSTLTYCNEKVGYKKAAG